MFFRMDLEFWTTKSLDPFFVSSEFKTSITLGLNIAFTVEGSFELNF